VLLLVVIEDGTLIVSGRPCVDQIGGRSSLMLLEVVNELLRLLL
jgi:hypothetical protein